MLSWCRNDCWSARWAYLNWRMHQGLYTSVTKHQHDNAHQLVDVQSAQVAFDFQRGRLDSDPDLHAAAGPRQHYVRKRRRMPQVLSVTCCYHPRLLTVHAARPS